MLRKHKKIILLILLYVPLILICFILQATVFSELPLGGAKPLILPVASVSVAMHGGRVRGGVFGLFAGILSDVALGSPTILFTLLLTCAGIIVGVLFETVLARGFPSYVLCCAAVLIIAAFCQMFGLLFFRGESAPALLSTAAFQTIYSLFFTVPMYLITRPLGRMAV